MFGRWILIEVGNTHIANTVNTVVMHHEIKWTVRFLVTVFTNQCVVTNRKTLSEWTHPSEGAYRPIHMMNLQYLAVMLLYYKKGLCCLLSGICNITVFGEKGEEKTYKYHVIITYYYSYITYIFTYYFKRDTERSLYI